MRLPDDLRRIRDAADPAEISAIKIGALGGLVAVGGVFIFKLAAWWLVWASAQLDSIAALVSLY